MRFPEVSEIRTLIQKAKPAEAKYLLMAEYLFCARVSELVSKKYLSDVSTTPRSLKGNSIRQEVFRSGKQKHDVIVVDVETAKRNITRYIAIPLEKTYEPFAEKIFAYMREFGKDPCFPFTRQHAYFLQKKPSKK